MGPNTKVSGSIKDKSVVVIEDIIPNSPPIDGPKYKFTIIIEACKNNKLPNEFIKDQPPILHIDLNCKKSNSFS